MKKTIKAFIVSLLIFVTFAIIATVCAAAGAFFTWAWLVDKIGLAAGTWSMAGIMVVLLFVAYKIDNWGSPPPKKVTVLPKKDPEKGTVRVYISGKITGLPFDTAYSKFEEGERLAIEEIKKQRPELKIEVINPMKLSHRENADWVDFMAIDLEALMRCNAIYLLDNYYDSKGARIEYQIAKEMEHFIMPEDKHIPSKIHLIP